MRVIYNHSLFNPSLVKPNLLLFLSLYCKFYSQFLKNSTEINGELRACRCLQPTFYLLIQNLKCICTIADFQIFKKLFLYNTQAINLSQKPSRHVKVLQYLRLYCYYLLCYARSCVLKSYERSEVEQNDSFRCDRKFSFLISLNLANPCLAYPYLVCSTLLPRSILGNSSNVSHS